MGIQDREYDRRLSLAQERNSLITLIAINLVVFVILIFIRAILSVQYGSLEAGTAKFQGSVVPWFSLPADLSKLATRPWTVLTHMFTHIDVWHILGNMIWLWVFGFILHDLTGNKKIIPIYLYGGLAGALAYLLFYNLAPGMHDFLSGNVALGASAGVMAVAVAVTTISPGYRIFTMLNGGFPIWILTVIYLLIDLASVGGYNSGGHIAHLAGALAGFLFVFFYQRGYDGGAWINRFFDWCHNLFNPEKPSRKTDIKQELFYKATTKPYKRTPNITEQRIDEILDKISQKGIEALTDEEKELLKRASKE
ncbi:MAG: rhomboid family intramembrane serine protease [Chitinophagaceae bacterium]|nr:rhomboid family intramembrane serine protease [Chitinophagaceae bacterium]